MSIISTTGQCGNISGNVVTCTGSNFGESCSQWGWCGREAVYNGAGCQPDFGKCDGESSSSSIVDPTTFATVTKSSSSCTEENGPITTSSSVYSYPWTNSTTGVDPASSFNSFLGTGSPITSTSSQDSSSSSVTPIMSWSTTAESSLTTASPTPTPTSLPFQKLDVAYTQYSGTGEPSEGWPDQTAWVDFDTLWSLNQDNIMNSCSQWGQENDSAQEISDLQTAINTISANSGVDNRFILAVVMQESKGCVRAPETIGSVVNPGLMQSYQGSGTCNTGTINSPGTVTNPCPASEIQQMIQDGTQGTGDGTTSLVQGLATAGTSDVSQYYKAARIYNSGSIDPSGQLQDGVATHCYSSDIANRLIGWTGSQPSTCTFDG